jgi:hypothetical protein
MRRAVTSVLFVLSGLPAIPLIAQSTSIGGGTCNSSNLNGSYTITVAGRQVASSGTFTNVLQANGTATFDGESQVTIALTADNLQAVATSLPWSGSYSVQANCEGQLTVSTGANITFNLVLFNNGTNFLLTGSDSTYSYSGSGNTQPASCSAGMLDGVYTFNATGYSLNGTAVTGAEDAGGLLQFDGNSNVIVNVTPWTLGTPPSPLTLTGTYSVTNCTGSAKLTDSNSNSYSMSFSVSGANRLAITALSATLSESGKFIMAGTAHAIYGQPAATPNTPTINGGPPQSALSDTRKGGRS